jgi:hypothetical protein
MSLILETEITPLPGDFACLQISGQVGELIRVGQWLCGDGFHNFEHTEVKVDDTQTLGAYPGGADLVTLPPVADQSRWLWSAGVIPLTDAQRAAIVKTAMSLRGTPYSALDYFAIAAHRLHIPDPDNELERYIGETGHMICSQLVDYCYMTAGVHLFNDKRWPGYVTPADLANVIQHPESIVYGKARSVRRPMPQP